MGKISMVGGHDLDIVSQDSDEQHSRECRYATVICPNCNPDLHKSEGPMFTSKWLISSIQGTNWCQLKLLNSLS